MKRALKGNSLPLINPLVDLYNCISLRWLVCAGAEDLDACRGDIRLAYAQGDEQFRPLGEAAEDPPEKGELVYRDDLGVLCRRLNWRESDRTKITGSTTNAVVVLEAFSPLSDEDLRAALTELSSLLARYCRADTRLEILSITEPSCFFPAAGGEAV